MRRRFIVAAVLLLGLGVVLAWAFSRPKEPVYEGKPLSFWLQRYTTMHRDETSIQEADHALDAIGTNAIPTLLRLVEAKDSRFKVQMMALLGRQHFVKVGWLSAEDKQSMAIEGFARLRNAGSSAVPSLIEIYQRNVSDSSQGAVMTSLLVMDLAAKDSVPMLIDLSLQHTKYRRAAIDILGAIHLEPDLVVPALVRSLDDPDVMLRTSATHALAEFGPQAQSAVPRLKAMLSDDDQIIRRGASNALEKICRAADP